MHNPTLPAFQVHSIGVVHSDIKQRYEAPRQGVLSEDISSVIKLHPGNNFQQALTGLEGFERIWVVFLFHLNPNWNPMVTPPRHTRKKVGVFASRSPHRPSQIGISCVKLEKISGLKVFISEADILDGSPVLDIKPYLPYSDSFPEVQTGWVDKGGREIQYGINFTQEAKERILWLKKQGGINLRSFVKLQLEFNPEDSSRKRISPVENKQGVFILSYRTWRIEYKVSADTKMVEITGIYSGYSETEMNSPENDQFGDKLFHSDFLSEFGSGK